jgi:hypothetical protein
MGGIGIAIWNNRRRAAINNNFVTTWQTTTPAETITLPFTNHGTYDAVVDWGDGSTSNITAYNDAAVTHTYADAGTYTVSISGTMGGWSFNNGGDKLKIKSIENWGNNEWQYLARAFYGCLNLISNASDIPILSDAVTDLNRAFANCNQFTQDFIGLNTSYVTNFSYMFYASFGASPVFNGDLSTIDTASAVNFSYMFNNANSFDQDISSWDFSNATNITNMLKVSNLSTANYDLLLLSLSAQSLNTGLLFNAAYSKYSAGAAAAARQYIIDTFGWTIVDGGQA